MLNHEAGATAPASRCGSCVHHQKTHSISISTVIKLKVGYGYEARQETPFQYEYGLDEEARQLVSMIH